MPLSIAVVQRSRIHFYKRKSIKSFRLEKVKQVIAILEKGLNFLRRDLF